MVVMMCVCVRVRCVCVCSREKAFCFSSNVILLIAKFVDLSYFIVCRYTDQAFSGINSLFLQLIQRNEFR